MPVGFSKKPKDADKDPKRRPQTVTVADASGQRTMSLDEYRASDRGQAAANRALYSGEIGGRHPDIVFGAPTGRAQTEQELAYRNRYNTANMGMPEVRPQDALKNVAAMIAIAAGGAAASGWAPGAAAPTTAAPAASAAPASGGIGAGFGTNPGGLGVFANGGTAGMGTVGSGNAGLLTVAGGAGPLGGGFLGSLAARGGTIGNNTGLSLQSQLEGGGESPMQMLAQQQPQQQQGMFGSTPIKQPVLPGMPQGPTQAFGRRPFQFQGTTVWL
jgi:hypothetical protein